MPDFVVLALVAPIGAFGGLAGHERRGSHAWPGRSAILGLVGGALGVRRDDVARQQSLGRWRTAVAVLSEGRPLRDYHTVQTVPRKVRRPQSRPAAMRAAGRDLNTVITQRDYLTDCVFAVTLWGGDDPAQLADALRRPVFVPYLGRKSCPLSAPMDPHVVSAAGPVAALAEVRLPDFLQALGTTAPDPARPLLVASDEPLEGARSEVRWDEPLDRLVWHFAPRTVHIASPGRTE